MVVKNQKGAAEPVGQLEREVVPQICSGAFLELLCCLLAVEMWPKCLKMELTESRIIMTFRKYFCHAQISALEGRKQPLQVKL